MHNHPLLAPVKPEKRFILPDGSSIASLKELAQRLPSMPEAMFKHHVTPSKNDFYAWTSHVIRDTHLSKEMKDLKDQSKIARLVSKRVAELEARDARREISQAVITTQTSPQKPLLPAMQQPRSFAPSPPPSIPATKGGFKPLLSKKRYRPVISGSTAAEIPSRAISPKSFAPSAPTRLPAKDSPASSTELIDSPEQLTPTIPVTIDDGDIGPPARVDEHPSHHDVPKPPAAYYSPTMPGSSSTWQSSASCDHASHFSCMRCGMVEFGIGLTIGILTTLMFSKAFL